MTFNYPSQSEWVIEWAKVVVLCAVCCLWRECFFIQRCTSTYCLWIPCPVSYLYVRLTIPWLQWPGLLPVRHEADSVALAWVRVSVAVFEHYRNVALFDSELGNFWFYLLAKFRCSFLKHKMILVEERAKEPMFIFGETSWSTHSKKVFNVPFSNRFNSKFCSTRCTYAQ